VWMRSLHVCIRSSQVWMRSSQVKWMRSSQVNWMRSSKVCMRSSVDEILPGGYEKKMRFSQVVDEI
jgi:hypothetical protein